MAFVSAFVLTTILHESGHYLTGFLFGSGPTLYHNYVESAIAKSGAAAVLIALAGPFVSLFQGLGLSALLISHRKNNSLDLLLLWMALLGFVNFFGYLMFTPISKVGDTGRVAAILHLPFFVQLSIAVLGLGILLQLVMVLGKEFARFIPPSQDRETRGKYVSALLLYPLLLGSLVNVSLAFPVVAVLSIIYPATSSFVILSSYGRILQSVELNSENPVLSSGISHVLLGVCFACVLVNRLLTLGL